MRHFPHYSEFIFQAVRSRGPGGQNVNRTNSAAILYWNPQTSMSLSPEVRERLVRKLSAKLNQEGFLLIRSDVHRDLDMNKKECIERLRKIIQAALFVAPVRIKTKPHRGAVLTRLTTKKRDSAKKRNRSRVTEED